MNDVVRTEVTFLHLSCLASDVFFLFHSLRRRLKFPFALQWFLDVCAKVNCYTHTHTRAHTHAHTGIRGNSSTSFNNTKGWRERKKDREIKKTIVFFRRAMWEIQLRTHALKERHTERSSYFLPTFYVMFGCSFSESVWRDVHISKR